MVGGLSQQNHEDQISTLGGIFLPVWNAGTYFNETYHSYLLSGPHTGAVLGRQNTSSEQPPPNMAAINFVVINN